MSSIKPKSKPCKGIGKAFGVIGCGTPTLYRTYGLCNNCLSDFLFDNDKGKLLFEKEIKPKAQRKVKVKQSKETKEAKKKLLSPDNFRAKYAQPKINLIARLIDYGCSCIATNNNGKMNGGHRISVGANRSTSLNLHNIHIQTFESNHFKSGDNMKYDIGIVERYGDNYLKFLNSLHQTPKLGLNLNDYEKVIQIANSIIKALENENKTLTEPREAINRIELRNRYNFELGIYQEQQAIYNPLTKL